MTRYQPDNPSIQPPYGIRPTNPVPVDWYSGPFTGSNIAEAVSRANQSIFPGERFRSLEVRLLVGSDTYKYWYYGGTADADLIAFAPAGSLVGDYVQSLNSLTGPLQISAGSNVQITVEGNNKLVITSLDATFDSDITASIPDQHTFGKYKYGQRVPSLGRTALEVIRESLLDAVSPLASLTSDSSVLFNQTAVSNTLYVSHTIRTIGATGATGVLQVRRSGTGTWVTLNSTLFNPNGAFFSGTHGHTLTDAPFGASGPFNYRYIVFDSRGASAEATLNIPLQGRNQIGRSLAQTAVVNRGGVLETDIERERGNVQTRLSASVSRTNTFVPLTTWAIEYQQNGAGGWIGITSGSAPGGNSFSIPQFTHTPPSTLNQVNYRLAVRDTYLDSISQSELAQPARIRFGNFIWFGPTSGPPTTSAHIRSGGLSAFNPNVDFRNPFDLITGTQFLNLTVALPSPSTMVTAIDTVNSSQDIVLQFVTGNASWGGLTSVSDFTGNAVSYNVYNYFLSDVYDPQTIIRITRTT